MFPAHRQAFELETSSPGQKVLSASFPFLRSPRLLCKIY